MFSNISKKTFFLLPALFLSSYVIGAGAGASPLPLPKETGD